MGIDDECFAQDERGWRDSKQWVCQRCVSDDGYLLYLVRKNLALKTCSYCGSQKRKAAALSALMDALVRGIKYSYNDEVNAGYPYDKDISTKYLSYAGVLQQILDAQSLDWPKALIRDVAASLTTTGWVDAPDGDWMGAHHHEQLYWSWASFTNAVSGTEYNTTTPRDS